MAGDSATLVVAAPAAPETTRSGAIILDLAETFPVVEVGDDGLPVTTDPTRVDGWTPQPDLEFLQTTVSVGTPGSGTCVFQRRFGRVKQPHQSDYATVKPVRWRNWWVRARLIDENGAQSVIFIGQIGAERRLIGGEDVRGPGDPTKIRSSRQVFTAYGPQELLEKTFINESLWLDEEPAEQAGAEPQLVRSRAQWTPNVNRINEDGTILGNRAATETIPDDESDHARAETTPGDAEEWWKSHLFSGAADALVWSRLDFCQYVLNRFVNQFDDERQPVGPVFRMAGRTDLLDSLEDYIDLGDGDSVLGLLRRLIDPQMGLDFYFEPTHAGWNVVVFSMLAEDVAFGTARLTANTRPMALGPLKQYLQVDIVRSEEAMVGKIRIIGKRLVMCCSLFAEETDARPATLVKKWSDDLEDAYNQAAQVDDGPQNDRFRLQAKFRPVYSDYGAPDDWDFQDHQAAPLVGDPGDGSGAVTNLPAEQQRTARATLSWLPLRMGVDYSPPGPAVDHNPEGARTSLLSPQVWVFLSRAQAIAADGDLKTGGYTPADRLRGVGVHALRNDWGVHLEATPNHLLALGVFDAAGARQSAVAPMYNPAKMAATIAFETDQRLNLEYVIDDAEPTVLVIEEPTAELWALAEGTIVGVNAAGELVASPKRILRDDTPKLHLRMAGAIARYQNSRHRARVVAPGYKPWAGQLGAMLRGVDPGGDLPDFAACITAIEWEGGENPRTTLTAGYMR